MTAHDLRIVAEVAAREQEMVAERDDLALIREYKGLPDDLSVSALALQIQTDPVKAAQRIVTLEGQQRIMRDHLEALTRRLGAMTLHVDGVTL